MEAEKPYLIGYATSGRSHCRTCTDSIMKGSLRIAQLVQSQKFDGLVSCFIIIFLKLNIWSTETL